MAHPVQERDDRTQIADLLHSYAFAIDDQDWGRLLDVFSDRCTADYGRFGCFESAQAVHDWMRDAHVGLTSHHALANVVIELRGDDASARSYVTVTIQRTDDPSTMLRTGGEYRDRLSRVDGRWRISEREYRTVWQDGSLAG
ncbi:MAG: nuclear transport factor 2 family protein [Ilumatobacteraceae bacterium]